MNRTLKLTINKPCSENFNNFQSTERGGYCDLCKKEVIDFTKMSQYDILQHINNGSKTCGYFRKSQLKNYSVTTIPLTLKKRISYFGAKVASFVLFSVLSINKGQAQEKELLPNIEINTDKSINRQDSNAIIIKGRHYVSGVLVDKDNNEPLPYANVVVLRDGRQIEGVMTDFDGRYSFSQLLYTGDKLAISYVGYRPVSVEINEETPSTISLITKLDSGSDMYFMGEVVIDEIYTSEPSFWQKLKMKFK